LGVTGSVAAMRTPALTAALRQAGHEVKVVATQPATYFFNPTDLPAGVLVRDADEWPGDHWNRGDPVLHIELRKWADVLVIAPLDANTLAKLAQGLADNCLTCVARAWDPARPMVLAPAMNTLMWRHPATARHLRLLAQDWGPALRVIEPVDKELACGDVGVGGLAEVAAVVAAIP
jgi:phosphopantothenoylcysteine decarboxylase